MEIETFAVGALRTNCYLVYSKGSKAGFLIDPGSFDKRILNKIKNEGIRIKNIINTHGHPDHTTGNKGFGYPVLIHEDDNGMLSSTASGFLKDGDLIKEADIELEVIHTPGHTPGGISLRVGNIIFTGDTLFQDGVGRTDFPYSSEEDLVNSLRRLMEFSDETEILPGHGARSTIGSERKNLGL